MKNDGRYFADASSPAGPAPELEPWGETTVVGSPEPRVDAYERVSGTAVYASDVILPGMLYGAILRCPHAHATVKGVSTARAEAMPGVHAVITNATPGASLPWYRMGEGFASTLFDPHCRYQGEEVAAVAADTPQQAADALAAVDVTYEVLPFVIREEAALAPGAPAIHEGGNRMGEPELIERGDVARGLAEADAVVKLSFRTACELHTPMEPHGSVARWDGGRLTVWDTTQGVFPIQSALAKLFSLPLASVRVIGHYMGGGFGSKLEPGKYTAIAALLARSTGRPVKLFLSREETFLAVGNRPANIIDVTLGAKKDGTLTAVEYTSLGSGGAYPAGADSGFPAAELYLCPNVRVRDEAVYINAGKARPMRAPGFPQAAWALEQAMDELAVKLGMDAVELRLKNIPLFSQVREKQPYTSTGLRRCLEEGAAAFGWTKAKSLKRPGGELRRGVGVASCIWGYGGGPPSTAIVKLFADGSVNLNLGASDIGTGTKTVMAMVVAEELGVPLARIQVENADTATTQFATASGGSKTVPSDSPAVRAAAVAVRKELLRIAGEELEAPPEELALAAGEVVRRNDPTKKVAVSALAGLRNRGVLVGVGTRGPNPKGKIANPFAAHFAEVEVNLRTGELAVLRVVAAQDSGRVLNRLTFENQVIGGITMGIGFAATEARVLDRQTGTMPNANWHDYLIPGMMDVPTELECVPVDPHDTECNTTGAKGLGEPATIPTAAAIANAVYDAVGVRVAEAPITPGRLVALLARRKEG